MNAYSDYEQCVKDCNVIILCMPHQFIFETIDVLSKYRKDDWNVISLIKGIYFNNNNNEFNLISDVISKRLNLDCSVLMGANVAKHIAKRQLSESTLGCKDGSANDKNDSKIGHAHLFSNLFNNSYFKIRAVNDYKSVELCGALKNIIALGVGFISGLNLS